jgi:hypothetical protein
MSSLIRCFLLSGLILITLTISVNAVPQRLNGTSDTAYIRNSASVLTAAKEGLDKFLNNIPAGYEQFYGFESRDEFKDAKVESPILIYTLSLDFLGDNLSNFTNYIQPTNDWKIPVTVNGASKIFLQVTKFDGTFKAVDMGGHELALEIYDKLKFYNLDNDIYLLRLYQIASDLLLIIPKDKDIYSAKVLPLNSALKISEELGVRQNTVVDINNLAPVLRKIYQTPFK